MDASGRAVPFLRTTEPERSVHDAFVPFTVLRNDVLFRHSIVELELPPGTVLDHLILRVRNADADKPVRITGSDDRRQWYMIKDSQLALRGTRDDPAKQQLAIPLPHVDRKYLRIELNDSLSAAVEILEAGVIKTQTNPGNYVRDSTFHWTRRDSSGHTLIEVRSPHPLVIDRLVYHVQGDLPFRRQVRITRKHSTKVGRGRDRRTRSEHQELARSILRSGPENFVDLNGLRADSFTIWIDNWDDRPLQFTGLESWQLQRSIYAHLEAGNNYHLTTGNDRLTAARYDQTPFHDARSRVLRVLHHDTLQAPAGSGSTGGLWNPGEAWLWIAVATLALAMGISAFRMLRSMPNEEQLR